MPSEDPQPPAPVAGNSTEEVCSCVWSDNGAHDRVEADCPVHGALARLTGLGDGPPWGTISHQQIQDAQGNRIFQIGDVLEDSNGYCLLVTGINQESGTFMARDFPEQVFEPMVRVTREIRIIPNLADFFVIRPPTPDEVRRIQRAAGVAEDGIMGPRTIAGFHFPADAVEVTTWETVPSGETARWDETGKPLAPTRFERDVDPQE